MTGPSSSSRRDRVKTLLGIVLERAVRGALGSVPWAGAALDNLTFGLHESLSSRQLKRQLDELIGQVRLLSEERDANATDRRRARPDLPAAVELQAFLNGLSDPDYRDAEDRMLELLQSLDRLPAGTAAMLRMALDSIVSANEALQRQISQLRDIERLRFEGVAERESLRSFITMAKSVRGALAIRDSGRDPTWYLDASVLSDFLNPLDDGPGMVEPAVSRYLIRAARPQSLKIPGAQVQQLVDRLGFALERATTAVNGSLDRAYSLATSIREFMALPQDWMGRRPVLSAVEISDQNEFTHIVAKRLGEGAPGGHHESHRFHRLYRLASAVAETRADGERSGPAGIAVLVARGRFQLLLERMAGDYPNVLVTHSYGPAWLCFLERESPGSSARATREIDRAVTEMESAAPRDRRDASDPKSGLGWEREVRRHLPQFLRAASEFHQAVAEEIDRFRQEMLDDAGAWTDSLLDGSERFGSLLAWLDSVPGSDPPAPSPTPNS